MRFINRIFTATMGERWDNRRLMAAFAPLIERLPMEDEPRGRLLDFVRFQLVGERGRRTVLEDWSALDSFASRASAFERGAELALDALCEQIAPAAEAAGIRFDAVIATTATGNLMPGLTYRAAQRLGGLVRPDSLL